MKFMMRLKCFKLYLVRLATNFISFQLDDDFQCCVTQYFDHLKGYFDKISDNLCMTLFFLLCEILPYFHKRHCKRIVCLQKSRFHKIFDILVVFSKGGCRILLSHTVVHANQS